MESLHKAGIKVIGDVGIENLKNGKIFSFSESETSPYFGDKLRDDFDAEYCQQYDFVAYENRFEESE